MDKAKVVNTDIALKKQLLICDEEIKLIEKTIRTNRDENIPLAFGDALLATSFIVVLAFVFGVLGYPVHTNLLSITAVVTWIVTFFKSADSNNKEYIYELHQTKVERKWIEKGYIGEAKVAKVISELKGNYILINDITIPTKKGDSTQIDHILLCPNGSILCIETKNISGIYYPHGRRKWSWFPKKGYIKGDIKYLINSPQNQSTYHANQLNYNLNKHEIPLSAQPIVVMVDLESEYKGETNNCPVIKINNLQKFISVNVKENSKLYTSTEMESFAEEIMKFGILSVEYDKS